MDFNRPNLIVGPIRNEQLRRDRCCETINTIFAILLTIIAIGVCITISEYYRVLRETGQIMSGHFPDYELTTTRVHTYKSRTKLEVDLAIKICTIPMLLNCILFIWAIVLLWGSKVVKAKNTRDHIDRCHFWQSVSSYSSKLTLIVFLPVILFGLPDIDHKVAILFMHMLCFMVWLGQRQKIMILLGEVMRPTQVQMSIRPMPGGGIRGRSNQQQMEGNEIVIAIPVAGEGSQAQDFAHSGHAHAHVSPFDVDVEELPKYITAPPPSYADVTAAVAAESASQDYMDTQGQEAEEEAPPPNYSEIKPAPMAVPEESSAL